VSFAFPAAATVLKEAIFRQAAADLGRPLDVLVVNALCSTAQVRRLWAVLCAPKRAEEQMVSGCCVPLSEQRSRVFSVSVPPTLHHHIIPADSLTTTSSLLIPSRHVPHNCWRGAQSACLLLPRSSLSPGFVPGAALLMLGVLVFNAAAWAPAAVAAARRAAAWWSRLARGDISGDSGSGGSDAPRRLAGS
jgi:hypothetical protein